MAELFQTTVRVFWKKEGRIKYISHLDINRCMARALKRSRLPVWHTLGFNPHIYTTFALPLALGYESECESVDFRLTEQVPMREVVDRLNAVFPEGMAAYHAAPAVQKPEAICWADYRIIQEFDHIPAEQAARTLSDWCERPALPVLKKTKKGERMVDVKPHFSVQGVEAQNNVLTLSVRAAAGASLNINPTLVRDTFAAETGTAADWQRVVRTAILDGTFHDFR